MSILCATAKMVQSLNSLLIVFWTSWSVSESTEAVASSSIRILLFLRRARARHISCLFGIKITLFNSDFLYFLVENFNPCSFDQQTNSFHLLKLHGRVPFQALHLRTGTNGQVEVFHEFHYQKIDQMDPNYDEVLTKIILVPKWTFEACLLAGKF